MKELATNTVPLNEITELYLLREFGGRGNTPPVFMGSNDGLHLNPHQRVSKGKLAAAFATADQAKQFGAFIGAHHMAELFKVTMRPPRYISGTAYNGVGFSIMHSSFNDELYPVGGCLDAIRLPMNYALELLQKRSIETGVAVFLITRVFVPPDLRNFGIADRMFKCMLESVRPCDTLVLQNSPYTSDTSSRGLEKLFIRHGFKPLNSELFVREGVVA